MSLVYRAPAWYHHVVSTFWTPERIDNYKSASEYTSFHRKLSVLAEPYLDENWAMADIGCGPGMLDYWMAPMVKSIDAIDNDTAAIDYLTNKLEEIYITNRNISNKIRPRLASLEDITDEMWDVVLLSFFGVNEYVLKKVLPLANRRLLIFIHGRPDTAVPFSAEKDGNTFTVSEMEKFLKEKNYSYKKNVMEMQFGQPFKSIGDIHSFLSSYDGGDDFEKRKMDAEERIIKTNRIDYPYYLPKSISVALFIISALQNNKT
jgi:SAM-dependent methyltransferase